jgi:hypothetical protein
MNIFQLPSTSGGQENVYCVGAWCRDKNKIIIVKCCIIGNAKNDAFSYEDQFCISRLFVRLVVYLFTSVNFTEIVNFFQG